MEQNQPINISIARGNDSVDDKYNQFKEYVIINHLDLQKETAHLKDEITGLRIELQDKEIEEDKYDARTRYFRSLLTNMNELKKGYLLISSKRNELLDIANIRMASFYSVNREYHIKLILLNMVYIMENILFQYFKVSPVIIALYLIVNSTIVYYIVYNYQLLYKLIQLYKNNKDSSTTERIKIEIRDKTNELTKLDESTLSLENWVYEV